MGVVIPLKAYWTFVSFLSLHIRSPIVGFCSGVFIEFSCKFGLERYYLQFHYDIAVQRYVEKEQVYSTAYACYDYFFLSSDECETCTEFEEETGKVLFQFVFKLAEIIVVFGNGLCKVALRRGQHLREVCDCAAAIVVKICFQASLEYCPAPVL